MPSQPERRFFSAPTLERAVMEAAGHYGVPPEELGYQRVEKQSGFTKRRKIVIRVDPDNLRAPAPELAQEENAAAVDSAAAPETEVVAHSGNDDSAAPLAELPDEGAPEEAERAAAAVESAQIEAPSQEVLSPLESTEAEPAAAESRDVYDEDEDEDESDDSDEEGRHLEAEAAEIEEAEAPLFTDAESEVEAVPEEAAPDRLRRGEMIELPASTESLRERVGELPAEVVESARGRLEDLLELAGVRLDAGFYPGEEGLEVELHGEDSDLVAEEEGQVIRALEHLLPRLMQSDLGRIIPCRVDCENFQALREERLRARAQQTAEEVRRRGQSKTLEPMHPADRRIVHLTLVPDGSVTTESVGRGYFRRVSVRPT